MFQLILYALIAAGLAFGGMKVWGGFTGQYVTEGKQLQAQEDEAVVVTAKKRSDAMEARALAAEADATAAKSAAAQQSEAIATMAKTTDEAVKAARSQSLLYAGELAKNKQRQDTLRAAASAAPRGGQTCEALLAATDSILRDSSARRQAP